MEESNVILLGSTGFIGSVLSETLNPALELSSDNVNQFLDDLKGNATNQNFIVVNCLSRSSLRDHSAIRNSNFLLPQIIAKRLHIRHWIQLSSYYSEFFKQTGRHFNLYSFYKDAFTEFLKKDERFPVSNLFLPHIYWPTESSNRFLSVIFRAFCLQDDLKLVSESQEVPVLSLKEAISEIIKRIERRDIDGYTEDKVHAELIIRLPEVLSELAAMTGHAPSLSVMSEGEANFFTKIDWPSKAQNQNERQLALQGILRTYQNYFIEHYKRS
jgi:hypothetical protein